MFSAVKRATLLYPSGPSGLHLMVLLTDPVGPPGYVLTVDICTVGHGRHDPTCILQPGDHPFLTAESFVYYRDLRADVPAQRLIDGVARAEFVDKGLMQADVFQRILVGVNQSPFAAPFARNFLAQASVPPTSPKKKPRSQSGPIR
jgi:hypothetical protein